MRIALCGPVATGGLEAWLERHPTNGAEPPPGSGAVLITQLAAALLERGHEVLIATLDETVAKEVILEGPRLRVSIGHYRHQHRARDAFKEERAYLTRALNRESPDIVHAHWTYEFALAALATTLPTLVTVHDWAPSVLRFHPHPYRAMRLLMNLRTLHKGRAFTTVSAPMRDRLSKLGVTNVAVVPNALPDALFRPRDGTYSMDRPELIALNNGFSRWKNVGALLRAFRLVREQIPGARLRLLGSDYEWGGSAHRWASTHSLAERVIFEGPVPNATAMARLRQAELFIHPSREESFGMVLVEAMASGLPVIAGRYSGGVPWVLDQGRVGVLTDVNSPRSIADAALAVLRQPATWGRLSDQGFKHAWWKFRLSKIVAQYLDCYEQVREGGSLIDVGTPEGRKRRG